MKELYFADKNRYDNGMEYELEWNMSVVDALVCYCLR